MVKEQDSNEQSKQLKDENNEPPMFERKIAKFEGFDGRFSQPTKDFSKQFYHVYLCRLKELKKLIIPRAKKLWGDDVKIVSLAELENYDNEKCIIIGTLFKHQIWKPSILRELSEETTDLQENHENYCSDKDTAYLEDEMLRIKIIGDNVDLTKIVTGVVCGLIGKKLDDGTFKVEDWCFPGCPTKKLTPTLTTSASSSSTTISDGKLLLLSGLDLANKTNNTMSLELLIEWITGMAGSINTQKEVSSIVNILIAGNSVKSTSFHHDNIQGLMNSKTLKTQDTQEISTAIKKLDNILNELLKYSSVILMPGEHDPTNLMLPQKPIHRFMLKNSYKYDNYKGVTNPWIGNIGNRIISGTSGQPIDDIIKVTGNNNISTIEWMEKTLEWCQFCPTAPDTLPSYPYNGNDLFIMQECPDIYFVGNADKFDTKLWKGEDGQMVRIICIPKFSTTNSAVLIDLKSLEVTPMYFGTC